MSTLFRTTVRLLALILTTSATQAQEIAMVPDRIDPGCRGGRAAIYDECGSQMVLFRQALSLAEDEGKTLLISYGAEWCIWCHVFEQYVKGRHGAMTYRFSDPGDAATEQVTLDERAATDPAAAAAALTRFVAERFVLLHVESQHSADGYQVLEHTGADAAFDWGLPFIFTVDAKGRYGANLHASEVETRRDGIFNWYRGYDRAGLTAELARMEQAAR